MSENHVQNIARHKLFGREDAKAINHSIPVLPPDHFIDGAIFSENIVSVTVLGDSR